MTKQEQSDEFMRGVIDYVDGLGDEVSDEPGEWEDEVAKAILIETSKGLNPREPRPIDDSWTSKLGPVHTDPASFAAKTRPGASCWVHPNGNIIHAQRTDAQGRTLPGIGGHAASAAHAGMTPDAVVRSGMVRINHTPSNGAYKGYFAVESGTALTRPQLSTVKKLHIHTGLEPVSHEVHNGAETTYGSHVADTKPYEADLRAFGQHPGQQVRKCLLLIFCKGRRWFRS